MRQIRQRLLDAVTIRQDRAVALRRTTLRIETYSLGSVRLYREDLQAIAKAAAELGALHIETDDFAGDDPADFAQLPAKLTELRISAEKADSDTKIVIELSRKNATVTVTEPDTLASGIRARVQEICRLRLRPLLRRPSVTPRPGSGSVSSPERNEIAAFIAAIGVVVTALTASSAALRPERAPAVGVSAVWAIILFGMVVGIVILVLFFLTLMKGTILINAYLADRPTFWQRKRDDIVISVVSFAAGGVLGYFVNQIS